LYPQTKFIYEQNSSVDYIGRFENLNQSIDYVSQRLGKKLPTLPHLNKSNRINCKFDSNSGTIKIIENLYKEDYQRFGYF
jgi:hypothetical protein